MLWLLGDGVRSIVKGLRLEIGVVMMGPAIQRGRSAKSIAAIEPILTSGKVPLEKTLQTS